MEMKDGCKCIIREKNCIYTFDKKDDIFKQIICTLISSLDEMR